MLTIKQLILFIFIGFIGILLPNSSFSQANKKSSTEKTSSAEKSVGIVASLAGSNAYLAFLSVGAIADNYGCANYDSTQVLSTLQSVEELMNSTLEDAQKAQKMASSREDAKIFSDIAEIYRTLKKEASHYRAYIRTKSDSDFKRFNDARRLAWDEITSLLGLK